MSLIGAEDSLNDIKNTLISTLVRAGNDRKSGYRFIIFNTIAKGFPNSRYVVLRKYDGDKQELFIYTDFRSDKIAEIKENPMVSVLAYAKQKNCQIKIRAKANIHHQDDTANVHWASLHGGKESYNTKNKPGQKAYSVKEADEMKKEIDDQYFAVIRLEVNQAEILQLNSEGHIRALFDFHEDNSHFLTP